MGWIDKLLVKGVELGIPLAAGALKLKRVVLPPKLEGEGHRYPPTGDVSELSFFAYRQCQRCNEYNQTRARFTQPPCPGFPPIREDL